jgi:hypothetical protein
MGRGSMNERMRREPEEQKELFDEARSQRPKWADLPHDARASVTELFARMLRQRPQEEARRPVDEVEHE